jgi:hypothetical protein
LGLSYDRQIWAYRVLFVAAPLVAGTIAHRVCVELQRGERVAADRERALQEAREEPRPVG